MNLPNKLTIFRVILIPFFVFFLLTDVLGASGDYLALVIFIVASLTDMLDGKIARKYNLVTNFGKFMDPLADKLLVCSAMICLVDLRLLPSWIVIIIIARNLCSTCSDHRIPDRLSEQEQSCFKRAGLIRCNQKHLVSFILY